MTDAPQSAETYFEGQMLLAMPAMTDPRFERAVIYMCAHSDEGAMGLVINKTLDSIDFRKLLGQLDITPGASTPKIAVHFGGPVENQRGFVLHSSEYRHDETLMIDERVGLTATLDILRALAAATGPSARYWRWAMPAGGRDSSRPKCMTMPGCPFPSTTN